VGSAPGDTGGRQCGVVVQAADVFLESDQGTHVAQSQKLAVWLFVSMAQLRFNSCRHVT